MDTPLNAKAALLQALITGPGFGLELIDRIDERSGGRFKFRNGSIYPALRSLERDGLVRSWEGEPLPERAGRPRRYYELTAEGSAAALEQRQGLTGLLVPIRVPS